VTVSFWLVRRVTHSEQTYLPYKECLHMLERKPTCVVMTYSKYRFQGEPDQCQRQGDSREYHVFLIRKHGNKNDKKKIRSEGITVSDGKRPDVSRPIRYVKMYSYAQCTMQERSMCCRDVPCLAHMEQGPGPLHPEHLPPPPYLPG
jgi:hypothetical protein